MEKSKLLQFTKKRKIYHEKLWSTFTLTNFSKFSISKSLFKFVDENKLLNLNQLGIRPFDSYFKYLKAMTFFQILTLTHRRYTVFIDISKAFEKIWILI